MLTLDYGSRYSEDSETRSDLDEDADAVVAGLPDLASAQDQQQRLDRPGNLLQLGGNLLPLEAGQPLQAKVEDRLGMKYFDWVEGQDLIGNEDLDAAVYGAGCGGSVPDFETAVVTLSYDDFASKWVAECSSPGGSADQRAFQGGAAAVRGTLE